MTTIIQKLEQEQIEKAKAAGKITKSRRRYHPRRREVIEGTRRESPGLRRV